MGKDDAIHVTVFNNLQHLSLQVVCYENDSTARELVSTSETRCHFLLIEVAILLRFLPPIPFSSSC